EDMGSLGVSAQLELILNGKGIDFQDYDSVPEKMQPVTVRKTVCYIVSAVLINEKNEVLMMQEAKWECYGKWYLPAGRMEQNETIVEAMKREVKEETGLECNPCTLLMVEERGPRWIRFVFLAEQTGGTLKTTSEADDESLQACWWDRVSPLPLRATDILPLISVALKYKENPSHPLTLPVELPYPAVSQRLVAAFSNNSSDLWVLLSSVGEPHLPVTACGGSSEAYCSIEVAIYRLAKECLELPLVNIKTHGLLGLQHLGKDPGKTDGVCFNTLVSINYSDGANHENPPELHSDGLQWWKVENQELRARIFQRLSTTSVVPIFS
uniref:8-oxo-dGDP phosphatase NUDT18 n=2 Tax=Latimeria chalumnae TaxID=7897 RepID=H3BC23_LATCH